MSRAQLRRSHLIIKTLHGAKVFGTDNYDYLVSPSCTHMGRDPQEASSGHSGTSRQSFLWVGQSAPDTDSAHSISIRGTLMAAEGQGCKESSLVLLPVSPHSCPPSTSLGQQTRLGMFAEVFGELQTSSIEEIVTVQLFANALDQYQYQTPWHHGRVLMISADRL